VVFNLVIEPPVHEIDQVCPHLIVHRRQDLSKVEGSGKGTAGSSKSVHVIPGMVSDDRNKSVHVGEELGKE
jgi:hypothetical protein